ncbi:mitochondrial ribosomal protein L37-domain-containing protein [Russula ochroleuca]|uniref:Large ribosomal subunit protein mL54 n=1 Tax=Russula ochroleuca TaxID=152965 RepID=A0A9P5MV08_9AGAM|nr:mitochondrial ribosomal protein L37-domain-containing protein [Russula ochroleuca]
MLARTCLLRQTQRAACARSFAQKAVSAAPNAVPEQTAAAELPATGSARSSCAPNTVMEGINYLKDQRPVLALPDEEYPAWLWTLLDKSELPDDGPGGKAEKRRLRKENRQRIRDQNFMKTQ